MNIFTIDDIICEILSYLNTSEQIYVCQVNKQVRSLCNLFNIGIVINSGRPKKFAYVDKFIFYIKNNKLHQISDGTYTLITLPNDEIPMYITAKAYQSMFILTQTKKLYIYYTHLFQFVQLNVPTDITSVINGSCYSYNYFVTTPVGLYEYSNDNQYIYFYPIKEPFTVKVSDHSIYIVTSNTCISLQKKLKYPKHIQFNTIVREDILSCGALYDRPVLLTTTGLYIGRKKIDAPFTDKIKVIQCNSFVVFILTDTGNLYDLNNNIFTKIPTSEPIINMVMDHNVMILHDNQNNYYRLDTSYKGNAQYHTIKKFNRI